MPVGLRRSMSSAASSTTSPTLARRASFEVALFGLFPIRLYAVGVIFQSPGSPRQRRTQVANRSPTSCSRPASRPRRVGRSTVWPTSMRSMLPRMKMLACSWRTYKHNRRSSASIPAASVPRLDRDSGQAADSDDVAGTDQADPSMPSNNDSSLNNSTSPESSP